MLAAYQTGRSDLALQAYALLGRIAAAHTQIVALSNRLAAVSHAALGVGVALAARRPTTRSPGPTGGSITIDSWVWATRRC